MHFPLIGKLCRQYGYRSEAKGRMVHTVCIVTVPGQAKAPTTSSDINSFYCTYDHTYEVLPKKTAGQQGVNLSGELLECRGCSMVKELRKPIARSTHTRASTLYRSRAPQQLPPIAEEGTSTAGEGASGKDASNQGEGTMEDLDSESDLDMTEVWPPVPPETREEAPAAETGDGTARVREATPQHHRSPLGGPISVAPTVAVATPAAATGPPAVTAATATTAGTFPRSWQDLRGAWRFSVSSPHLKADARGPIRGAGP